MKQKTLLRERNSKESYGVLTDISKDLNAAFGDNSGRSISRRTAHGFKKGLSLHNVDDDSAEFIVHTGMVVSGILLKSKEDTSQGIGILVGAALLGFYLNGK